MISPELALLRCIVVSLTEALNSGIRLHTRLPDIPHQVDELIAVAWSDGHFLSRVIGFEERAILGHLRQLGLLTVLVLWDGRVCRRVEVLIIEDGDGPAHDTVTLGFLGAARRADDDGGTVACLVDGPLTLGVQGAQHGRGRLFRCW